jgi:CheY-like chemotaxis protein
VLCDVLVIDDDPDARDSVVDLLRSSGIEAASVENGEKGLAYLRSCERKPKVVLLDLLMPELDGWAVLWRLRHDDELRSLPVILMTAISRQEFLLQEVAVARYLVKPFASRELLEALAPLLSSVSGRKRPNTGSR